MRFLVLGPLELRTEDDRLIQLTGPQQRMLLAKLLLHANQVVSTGELIHAVWGERLPSGRGPRLMTTSLMALISQLRTAIATGERTGPPAIVFSRDRGYLLQVDPERVDLHQFQRLDREGRQALASGDPARAADLLRQALGLWRGPALADVVAVANVAWPELVRIEERRMTSTEARIEAELALGRHHELVAELEALVRVHPLREQLHGQLMLALYRSGRAEDAVAAYQAARKVLAEEAGIEPGVGLQRLEQAVRALELSMPVDDGRDPQADRPDITPEEILEEAQQRLLAAPCFSAEEVRGRGHDPVDPQLIRLERKDGGVQFPAFQFDSLGRPVALVLAINRLLDAAHDPWGVADWWLGRNAWLDAAPADLLGRVDDGVLIAAAKAVLVEG